MQQAHRPVEVDLARAHHHALAADAAQVGELAARGKAPAVDDGLLCAAPACQAVPKRNVDAGCAHRLEEEAHGLGRAPCAPSAG